MPISQLLAYVLYLLLAGHTPCGPEVYEGNLAWRKGFVEGNLLT